jgi:hypothetical protein
MIWTNLIEMRRLQKIFFDFWTQKLLKVKSENTKESDSMSYVFSEFHGVQISKGCENSSAHHRCHPFKGLKYDSANSKSSQKASQRLNAHSA